MNARPPEGTLPDTLHWLHRPTGRPHWMVATWTGEAWNTMNGRGPVSPRSRDLVWWNYAGPATPPGTEPTQLTDQQMGV